MASDSSIPIPEPGPPEEMRAEADGSEVVESSEEHVKKCLQDADEMKQDATAHFRSGEWTQALATYTSALARLPKRVQEPKPYEGKEPPDPELVTDKPEDIAEGGDVPRENAPTSEPAVLKGVDLECAKARAVLNANIGACHVKLEEYKEAVKACSEALLDDPTYIKALQRRAACNEKIGSWSSLASAQEDYNTLLKLLPPDSPQVGPTKRSLAALKPRIEEAQKKETGEVLDKLKGIGNSILGNFGLSTDNFKFEPNGQGGYSMNFVR